MPTKKLTSSAKIIISLYKTVNRLDNLLHLPRNTYDVVYPDYIKFFRNIRKAAEKRKIQKLIDQLIRRGYLKRISKNHRGVIIPPKGLNYAVNFYSVTKYPRCKDDQHQMIIFDIPEDLHKIRDRFRRSLKVLGFKQFQKSVWISPCDTIKELKTLVEHYKIEDCVRYFLIQEKELE